MADVVITGTTPGACGCCAPPTPSCAVECISTQTSGCPQSPTGPGGECETITYPIIGTGCITFNTFIPCSCEQPPSDLIITAVARLQMSNLVIGRSYTATLIFEKQLSFPPEYQTVQTTFTASATVEYTSYTPIPDPTAQNEPGWVVAGCTILAN